MTNIQQLVIGQHAVVENLHRSSEVFYLQIQLSIYSIYSNKYGLTKPPMTLLLILFW